MWQKKLTKNKFKADSAVLISANEIFLKKFTENRNSNENNLWIIVIDNCDMKRFNNFLRYLYTWEIEDEDVDIKKHLKLKYYLETWNMNNYFSIINK